jgi:hypothetical protein
MKHIEDFARSTRSLGWGSCLLIFLAPILTLLLDVNTPAQEMEPGAYGRAPVGLNFVLVTYGHQTGDILTDSSLPLKDVSITLDSVAVAYGRTFGLFHKQANIGGALAYITGSAQGLVFENFTKVHRSGLSDLRVRFSINLHGSPALGPKEFAAFKRKTVVGASVIVVAPTGQYDPNRLVNLGANRWSFKPEVGISRPIGPWTVEAAGGVWLFTANNDFFGGHKRAQNPLLSLQGDVLYTFRPKLWIAVGGTYYRGGHTIIDGVTNADSQSNSRYGATFSYPFGKRNSLKIAASKGLTARFGGKLTSFAIGWQYTWL